MRRDYQSKVLKYYVSRPHTPYWSRHRTERAAFRERARAEKITGMSYMVWALHADGTTSIISEKVGK